MCLVNCFFVKVIIKKKPQNYLRFLFFYLYTNLPPQLGHFLSPASAVAPQYSQVFVFGAWAGVVPFRLTLMLIPWLDAVWVVCSTVPDCAGVGWFALIIGLATYGVATDGFDKNARTIDVIASASGTKYISIAIGLRAKPELMIIMKVIKTRAAGIDDKIPVTLGNLNTRQDPTKATSAEPHKKNGIKPSKSSLLPNARAIAKISVK